MDPSDVRCVACGYDLRGQSGQKRRCPECGTTNQVPECLRVRPLRRGWSTVALASTVLGLVPLLGFRGLLLLKNLRVMDLWNHARPLSGAPNPAAATVVGMGSTLAVICFYLAILSLPYCMIIACLAVWRQDFRAAIATSACAVLSIVYGLLAFQLGMIIAGI